jgi:uncharacterized protein (TIGR00255 family)
MTGYGKSIIQLPNKKVTIELKSLNSKNLDLGVRMPSYYKEKELGIRKILAKRLVRGKVDFSIYVEQTADKTSSEINTSAISVYLNQLREIEPDASSIDLLQIAMRLPEVMTSTREELDESEWETIEKGIYQCVDAISTYREDEGKSMSQDLETNISSIERLMEEVKSMSSQRIVQVKERLSTALDELKKSVDENRYEQELIYYLEKLDINEEMVRLENHLVYFKAELATDQSNGKKLGFIAQEIGREVNTTGSKSNYAPMQHLVVQMKNELEKIKEQILNIL